ncbi:MAG: DHH family phosphoesterase [Bacilli bacterium]|nr:DHH family phosphoesterase [Bacilli bacterium]
MGKLIKRVRIIAFVIIVLQIVGIATFSILYFNNLLHVKTKIDQNPIVLAIAATILIGIDCLFVWAMTVWISRIRQKTDLHAAEVIGSDIQEAYNFAMLGLAVTDEHDTVLWTNDLFKSRHLDIIDTNIVEWQPDLIQLKEANNSSTIVKLIINGRYYYVKYLSEAGLWIFKDTTDYEEAYNYSKEQAPVVGILQIDNYADATHGETEDFNDVITKVKNVIFNYTKEYGVLLRKFKDDSYSLLCNYHSLEAMKNDDFSIVDKVRRIGYEEGSPLTLSIGIAHDFPDVIKLNELAAQALDIAKSRGGDQVALSVYGSDMEFFGGRTEAQEKRNRVQIRVLADSLVGLIKASKRVLIMGHTQMDMDALGACLGVKAICNRVGINSRIVVDLKATEVKTRAALTSTFSKEELEHIRISPKEALDEVDSETLLVVVDVHTSGMTMSPALVNKATKVVVIDHHRRAEEYIDSPVLNHIDPSASSACELVTEFIKFASINPRIDLPSTYATIMLSGIFLDTGYFKSKQTGIRTFEACTVLKEYGADNNLAYDFLKDDEEEYFSINSMASNMKYHSPGVVYVTADGNITYDSATLSKVANVCLSMKGVKASFVIGRISEGIKISCRSDGTISVQLLAEKLGGGGHLNMSAVSFVGLKSVKEAEDRLLSVLDTYLNAARNDASLKRATGEDM